MSEHVQPTPSPWGAPPPPRFRYWREVALFAGAFCALLALGAVMHFWPLVARLHEDALYLAALSAAVILLVIPTPPRRRAWHWLANATALEDPRPLTQVWVLDGDTIEDRETETRYRLANIDAPETGDNAKCSTERARGDMAKWAAVKLVRGAQRVTVRPTWRFDRYGRRVAFVLVDGVDLGEELMKRGLARPWRGRRETWCGKRGGLARIAEAGAAPFACRHCAHWR